MSDSSPVVQEESTEAAVSSRHKITLGGIFYGLFSLVMNSVGFVMEPIQKLVGKPDNMGYIFVLPNLLIFGIFVLFPMLLNFYYAFTGGTNLFPQDRPFVGHGQLRNALRLQQHS